MKTTNTLVEKKEKKTFSQAITGDSLQTLIKKSVASPEAAARFTGTLISAVATTPQLQNCTPATVVAAALRGEGMGLTLNREYHLVPFANSCAFVIGYRGLIALCLAGNDVADMDCVEVRDGEYVGRDKRTKRPVFDFSVYQTDEESEKHKIIGWLAYVEMKDGYFRSEYMSLQDILKHASRYSKAFDIEKYNKMERGDLSPAEIESLKEKSPWYGNFEAMCRKTVLRRLLNSGFVRLANSAAVKDAINYDYASENEIIPDLDIESETIATTGEVVDAPEAPESAAPPSESDDKAGQPKTRQRAPRRAKGGDSGDTPPANPVADFFGEGDDK